MSGSEILPYLYNSNKPGTKTINTAPHSVETPTQGTILFIAVREASGPHSMGVRS